MWYTKSDGNCDCCVGSIFQKKIPLPAEHGWVSLSPSGVGALGQWALGLMSQFGPMVPAWTWWIFGSISSALFRTALSTLLRELPDDWLPLQFVEFQLLLFQLFHVGAMFCGCLCTCKGQVV